MHTYWDCSMCHFTNQQTQFPNFAVSLQRFLETNGTVDFPKEQKKTTELTHFEGSEIDVKGIICHCELRVKCIHALHLTLHYN